MLCQFPTFGACRAEALAKAGPRFSVPFSILHLPRRSFRAKAGPPSAILA